VALHQGERSIDRDGIFIDDEHDRQFVADVAQLREDSPEDLMGSDLHQTAIRVIIEGLLQAGPERGLPWHVSSQLMVLMPKERLGGKNWPPSPDVFVHPTAGPRSRTSWDVAVEGVPPFVAEVASPSTWDYDAGAKGRAYWYVGVREYLLFDPTTELLGEEVRARRQTERGMWGPWEPEADGRWHSSVLGVSFRPQGTLLRVYDGQGVLLPTISEQTRRIQEQERLLAEQARRTDEQARRIAELEAELQRLRGA